MDSLVQVKMTGTVDGAGLQSSGPQRVPVRGQGSHGAEFSRVKSIGIPNKVVTCHHARRKPHGDKSQSCLLKTLPSFFVDLDEIFRKLEGHFSIRCKAKE
eukprot:sb/3478612/